MTKVAELGLKWRAFIFSIVLFLFVSLVSFSCAINSGDVNRWEKTERGPDKLEAVLTHDKYDVLLRKEAAMSLIRMPSRNGIRLGHRILFEKHKDLEGNERGPALMSVNEKIRHQIVDLMVPELIQKMELTPSSHEGSYVDPSIPFKDAGFALLSNNPPFMTNKETSSTLTAALLKWIQTDFESRIENGAQQYGMQQMMRYLKAPSVKMLPNLITEKAYRVDRMAGLISEIGDDGTKQDGALALVSLAKKIESSEWVETQKEVVKDINKKNQHEATPAQLAGQIKAMQDARLSQEIFPALKKLGTEKVVVDFLLAYAENKEKEEERRKLAFAALEGKLDINNKEELNRLFDIARSDETPDSVRDLAFARLGEYPRADFLPKIYSLFGTKKWKVRWVAAELALRTMKLVEVDEWLSKLPSSNTEKSGFAEWLSYARAIVRMEGADKARTFLIPKLNSSSFGTKMTAISFFYENGKKSDEPLLSPLSTNNTAVPACHTEDDCQWHCDYLEPGSKEPTLKEVKTIGEIVRFCIFPHLR